MKTGTIYAGIGGWTYEPWRGVFYPKGLPHARELEYAAQQLTSIEINGTFYRTQTPKTSANGHRSAGRIYICAQRPALRRQPARAGGGRKLVERFLESGVTELGDRLGPLLWQFRRTRNSTRRFRRIPRAAAGETAMARPLRHVVEVRHDSSRYAGSSRSLRKLDVAIC